MRSLIATALRALYLKTRPRGIALQAILIGIIRPVEQARRSPTLQLMQPISNQRITIITGTKNKFLKGYGRGYPLAHIRQHEPGS